MAVSKMIAPALPHQIPAIVRGVTEPAVVWKMGTGTGKTLAACETLRILTQRYAQPGLHLVPNSIMEQTWEEYVKWYGELWTIQHVCTTFESNIKARVERIESVGRGEILLLSHESFNYSAIRDSLSKRIWCGVVVDEISRFRHWNHWVRGLLRVRSPHRIGASGSLVVKTCDDLWFPMKWIDPLWCDTTNHNIYKNKYTVLGGYTGTIPQQTRPDNEDEVKAYLQRYCVEADLSEIRDMPQRMLQVRAVNLPGKTQTAYSELEDTLMLELEGISDDVFNLQITTYASRMQRLLEIAAGFARNTDGEVVYLPCAKTEELVELLQGDSETPTIVWTWWVPEYKQVTERLTREGIKWVGLKDRNAFNEGRANVIIGSLASGGYGLNLTRAVRMIYHSMSFDLEQYQQSQERNWRLTTDDQPRVVIHLINRNTMDEYVRSAIVTKSSEALKFTRSSALQLLHQQRRSR